MSRKPGHLLILLGFFLLTGAGSIVIYNVHRDQEAGIQSETVLEELQTVNIKKEMENSEVPDYTLRPTMEMPENEVKGIGYIGVLEIPDLQLILPVISKTTKANLKVAPCRYTGSAYLDNLVIGAHNYETHFGNIDDLRYGDSVLFTDIEGNEFIYEVSNIEILQPEQVNELCISDWALSLYTCTIGGQSRIVVRCDRR